MIVLALAAVFAAALRIVSLAPALTEDLFAIGAGRQVVGVDAYSDAPAAARRLPKVGSMNSVDVEAIVTLRPDLVIGIPYQSPALSDVRRAGIATRILATDNIAGDLAAIATLGTLTGHAGQAKGVVRAVSDSLRALAADARRRPRLSALVLVGENPIYTAGAGSYLDDLLRLANLRNVAHGLRTPWPTYSEEALVRDQPDVLIVPKSNPPLTGAPWDRLRAVRLGRVVRIPDDELFRPGPYVARALHDVLDAVDRWR